MRVLVVATQVRLPDTHGGSTHVGELVSHLSNLGPVCLLAQRGSTAPGTIGISLPIGFPPLLKHLMPLLYFPFALKAARSFRPEVIYERGSSYGLGAMLAALMKLPLLTMVLDERVSDLSLRQANRIVATKLDLVPERYHQKTVRVSWGANTEHFKPTVDGTKIRTRLGVTQPLLAYAGSFRRWHDLNILVDALMDPALQHVNLLLVGDGPLRASLELRTRERGIASRVVFSGAVPYENVPEWLAAADICVAPYDPHLHPSSDGTFVLDPLKVFEYLAMEKPTVTIRSPNIENLFEDGVHLRLYRPGSVDEFVREVSWLLSHPSSSRTMAQAGRELVQTRHTWARHAEQLGDLFREMRGGHTHAHDSHAIGI